jgi:hypothetical protein
MLHRSLLRSHDLHEEDVRRHAGMCFDACHMAVEFEDPADALARLKASDVPIFKVQLSSALRVRFSQPNQALDALGAFAESTYLHQVVERRGTEFIRYVDLPEAFAAVAGTDEREWRVHFHVPIFLPEQSAGLSTTQNYLADLLRLLRHDPVCPHLEVETYTWDVLPDAYRHTDIATAIARELSWVVKQLDDE